MNWKQITIARDNKQLILFSKAGCWEIEILLAWICPLGISQVWLKISLILNTMLTKIHNLVNSRTYKMVWFFLLNYPVSILLNMKKFLKILRRCWRLSCHTSSSTMARRNSRKLLMSIRLDRSIFQEQLVAQLICRQRTSCISQSLLAKISMCQSKAWKTQQLQMPATTFSFTIKQCHGACPPSQQDQCLLLKSTWVLT